MRREWKKRKCTNKRSNAGKIRRVFIMKREQGTRKREEKLGAGKDSVGTLWMDEKE